VLTPLGRPTISALGVTQPADENAPQWRVREVLAFFGLTFLLTLPFWAISAASGKQFMPGLPIAAIAVLCPASAALLMVWKRRGGAAAGALLRHCLDVGRVKPAASWLLILLTAPAVSAAAFFILRQSGSGVPDPQFKLLPAIALLALFVVSAMSEELGWSGFALAPLQAHLGMLPAGLLIGAIWAVWHYPPLMQAHRSVSWIAWWSLGTVSMRLFMVWLFNSSGCSVFAMAIVHAISNLCWQLFPVQGSWFDPRINGLIWCGVALIVISTSMRKITPDAARAKPGT